MALSPSFACKHALNNSHRSLTPLSYVHSQASRRYIHTPRLKVAIPNPIGTTNIRNCISHRKKSGIACKPAETSHSTSELDDITKVVDKFCMFINMAELSDLLSDDCCIEDTKVTQLKLIPYNTDTKEGVMQLLRKIAAVMVDKNLQLKLDDLKHEKEKLTATLKWHLVEKESQNPHKNIRGSCTTYFSKNIDGRLLIRKLENTTMSDGETNQEPSSLPKQS